ncbi:MAG: LecA/PA-IL family lectin [Pyrinomonadaceae bacterium]
MFFKSKPIRLISLICLLFFTASFAFADTIRLKDGSIIKGKIISFDSGNFTVLIDDGTRQRQLNFSADQIESIIFDSGGASNPVSDYPPAKTDNDGKSTIITVGGNRPVKENPPVNPAKTPEPVQNKNISKGKLPPITIKVLVLADNTANGWTNSGWVVRKGQRIKIRGGGRVSLGNGRRSDAGGISTLPDPDKLIKDKPTGALIAVVGADNNDFIFIGESNEFVATRDGDLFLGVNEGNLNDNSGSFEVVIEIDPNTGD